MASTTSASRPLSHASKPVPEPSSPRYPLKKKNKNKIKPNQSSPQDKDGNGSVWAG